MKSRVVTLLVIVALFAVLGLSATAQDRTVVTWFVGLGTGGDPAQIEAQNGVVADFNASQDEIELVINIVPFESGRDTLSTLIAAGTPPDIVGPVGVGGSNAFEDQWLDLTPLVEATNYDLSVFDPALLDLYRTEDGALVGIPFAVFPALTYFNRGLFDEAGLNYPPQAFDEPYVMPDGTEVEWNYDTVAEIAKILTVDANGNDATSADFDPDNIVQFGMNFQWAAMRLRWTDMQPEVFYDAETNIVTIPESWRTGAQWIWDAVWTHHFMPNTTYISSALLAPSEFSSGNLAMAIVPLWYTCCLDNAVGNFEFDFGVVPKSFDGEYHVAMDADTFRIVKGSANPEAAFTALSYLLDEAVPALTPFYGAFPARPSYQQEYFDRASERYPFNINWQVAVDSLAFSNPINQHHESNHPNWQQGNDLNEAFAGLIFSDAGATMDLAAELDKLQTDLQAIVEQE
jgi:multiple sugar transport system substrate-binding protein